MEFSYPLKNSNRHGTTCNPRTQELRQEDHHQLEANVSKGKKRKKKRKEGAGEMALWLRVLAVLLEDPSSVPSTHVRQLPAGCNSSSRTYKALF